MWLVRYVIVMGKVNSTYLHPNEALIKDPVVYSIQVSVHMDCGFACINQTELLHLKLNDA